MSLATSEYSPPLRGNERNNQLLGEYQELSIPEIASLMGEDYLMIIQAIYGLPDAFGLCGIIAIHASGVLSDPAHWREVSYDPLLYKEIFDTGIKEKPVGPLGSSVFVRDFADLGTENYLDITLRSEEDLEASFNNLLPNQGLVVAFLLEYPRLGGNHTHWLAVQRDALSPDSVLVLGDMKPFGLKSFGVRMSLEQLAESISTVPGAKATTTLTPSLSSITQSTGLMTAEERFTKNASIYTFGASP